MKQLLVIACVMIAATTFSSCNSKKTGMENAESVPPPSSESGLNFAEGFATAGRLYPDKLRDIPGGIIAANYPNPCFAVYEDSLYFWKHNTSVQAAEDLQLVEYGAFVFTKKGWYLRVKMTTAEFAEHYHCKDGIIKKGMVYTDSASWRRDKKLIGGDALWYYLARDKSGRLVKGTAPIETEGKLQEDPARALTVVSSVLTWTGYGEIGNYKLSGTVPAEKIDIESFADSIRSVHISIDIADLKSDNKQLEEHLRGEDFFDVKKYPGAGFVSEKIEYAGAAAVRITGILTIKDVSKTVQFEASISKEKVGQKINGTISIDRTIFGIRYNSKSFFSGLGDQAIKDKFDLTFVVMCSDFN